MKKKLAMLLALVMVLGIFAPLSLRATPQHQPVQAWLSTHTSAWGPNFIFPDSEIEVTTGWVARDGATFAGNDASPLRQLAHPTSLVIQIQNARPGDSMWLNLTNATWAFAQNALTQGTPSARWDSRVVASTRTTFDNVPQTSIRPASPTLRGGNEAGTVSYDRQPVQLHHDGGCPGYQRG